MKFAGENWCEPCEVKANDANGGNGGNVKNVITPHEGTEPLIPWKRNRKVFIQGDMSTMPMILTLFLLASQRP